MTCKYSISQYTKDKANKLHVYVKTSSNKHNKIDVFDKKNNKKIASVGACGMMNYPSYIKSKGIKYANKRSKLYKVRHDKYRNKKGTNSYYADKLLW